MRLVYPLPVMVMRFSGRASCLLILCALSCISLSSRASAQEKPQESVKPNTTPALDIMEWGEGPDYFLARTDVGAPDGSRVLIYDYIYKSGKKGVEKGFKMCMTLAFRVLEDSVLPGTKERRASRRLLVLTRDSEGREGAALCRSEGKKRFTYVFGSSVEIVLRFEPHPLPK